MNSDVDVSANVEHETDSNLEIATSDGVGDRLTESFLNDHGAHL